MDPSALADQIRTDRAAGLRPFMIVGTAGTTSAGAVDPLVELADLARLEKLWFHVDGAWGAAAGLVPEMRSIVSGIELADSITIDAHKWLGIPIGAGMYLSRHVGRLARAFEPGVVGYAVRHDSRAEDPYASSMQWSRRFVGLKLFLSLLVAGWDGYARVIAHQAALGDRLRAKLLQAGWLLRNSSPLPVVCFADPAPKEKSDAHQQRIVDWVLASGDAWISMVQLGHSSTIALRACVASYHTQVADIDRFVALLDSARSAVK